MLPEAPNRMEGVRASLGPRTLPRSVSPVFFSKSPPVPPQKSVCFEFVSFLFALMIFGSVFSSDVGPVKMLLLM